MDILLKSLQRVFFLFGFLFLFFYLFTPLASAQSNGFNVTIEPSLKPEYGTPYTITVAKADGASYFKSGDRYIIRVEKKGSGCSTQGVDVGKSTPIYKAEIVEAGSKVVFTSVNKGPACLQPGDYKFSLFAQNTNASNLVASIDYIVTQPGGGNISIQPTKSSFSGNETITVNLINARKGQYYTFWWDGAIKSVANSIPSNEDGNHLNIPLKREGGGWDKSGAKKLCVANTTQTYVAWPGGLTCEAFTDINYRTFADPNAPPPSTSLSCEVIPKNPKSDESISLSIKNAPPSTNLRVDLNEGATNTPIGAKSTDSSGSVSFNAPSKKYPEGSYTFYVYKPDNSRLCEAQFTVGKVTSSTDKRPSVEKCEPGKPGCSSAAGELKKDTQGNQCIGTAIGCIPTNLNQFINAALVWTAGIAGGIAFLLMIYGSFQMITSQGNADQLKKGREQFVAAISGLLFIIFSITLLQIIGADILGLPGFGR